MMPARRYVFAPVAVAVALAAWGATHVERPLAEPPAEETARIAAHLERVERELRSRDVSHLTPAQRAARAQHLQRLREYRLRGLFPHNHDFPGERVPYFIDPHGTRCAMAYLIEQSGHGDFVRRIAETRNNARVRELADEPELVAWLDANGLTAAEAARIQPMYDDDGNCIGCIVDDAPDRELSAGEVAVGYSAALLGAVAIVANAVPVDGAAVGRGAAWRPALALGSGALGLAYGIPRLDDAGPSRVLGIVDAGVGAATLAVGAFRLLRGPGTSEPPLAAGPSLAPLVDRAPEGAARIGMRLRF